MKDTLSMRFRVTALTRSEHEGHPVGWSVTLQPVERIVGGGHNFLSFSFEGELPEGIAIGAQFELVPCIEGMPHETMENLYQALGRKLGGLR